MQRRTAEQRASKTSSVSTGAGATSEGNPVLEAYELPYAGGQAEAQPWIPQEYCQLSAGQYNGRCEVLELGTLTAVREHQNQAVHKSGRTPGNLCTVSVACTTDPAMRFSQFDRPENSWVYFLPAGTEFDLQMPSSANTMYICFEQDKLLAGARALDETVWGEAPRDLLAFNTPGRTDFLRTAGALFTYFSSPDGENGQLSRQHAYNMLMDSALVAMSRADSIVAGDTSDLHARRRVMNTVNAARGYIDGCLQVGQIPSIVEICSQLRVSERTLQYSFRKQLQVTPIAYLRIVRLNRVRALLLNPDRPDLTVTAAAMQYGFLHLGKFGQDYLRMFGERPRETLARSLPLERSGPIPHRYRLFDKQCPSKEAD